MGRHRERETERTEEGRQMEKEIDEDRERRTEGHRKSKVRRQTLREKGQRTPETLREKETEVEEVETSRQWVRGIPTGAKRRTRRQKGRDRAACEDQVGARCGRGEKSKEDGRAWSCEKPQVHALHRYLFQLSR